MNNQNTSHKILKGPNAARRKQTNDRAPKNVLNELANKIMLINTQTKAPIKITATYL